MDRINIHAGTKITVYIYDLINSLLFQIYHKFHDEVQHYRQHWWRCNGVCQNLPPFFGYVKRAMNRKPSPSDYWWKNHALKCSGSFIKVFFSI